MINWSEYSLAPWAYSALCIIYAATIISCIAVVLSENRNPIKSLAWVTVLIFLPIIGLVFYIFFGRSLKNMRMISRHSKRRLLRNKESNRHNLESTNLSPNNRQLIKLADSLAGAGICEGNKVEIFTDGVSKFKQFKEDLLNAKNSILIQYYIFTDDSLGNEIADILINKAAEGIKVQVMYDHIGSFSVKNKFFKRLKEANIEVHPFFRVTFPQLANRINWRNHRKTTIIDNHIGYIGGMNIADRYINGPSKGKIWRDTHLRIQGPIVNSFLYSFAIDWNFMNKDHEIDIFELHQPKHPQDVAIQLVASGPTDPWSNISMMFLQAITNAKKSIFIQTPYFLPTDALLKALQTAALAKVDVRIMIPAHSDSNLLRFASFSYISECLKAGIKFYLFDAGMLHSKNMIIDDDFVTTGSTNFDFRSFEHNFESNVFIYNNETNSKFREIFFKDIADSTKVTQNSWAKRPASQRLLESLIRLMSPVL